MKFCKHPALVGLSALGLGMLTFVGASGAAATAVPLGTATDFAVLAGSGITNTGATTIGGDSGSSPTSSQTGWGSCPGANCVTQTGTNHVDPDPNDSATQSAKAALTNAYNVAAGQTPTTVPTELAGQTLAPWCLQLRLRHIRDDGHVDARRRQRSGCGLHLPDG